MRALYLHAVSWLCDQENMVAQVYIIADNEDMKTSMSAYPNTSVDCC